MLRRKLSQVLAWLSRTVKGFLDNPLRVINAAGLAMGAAFMAIVVVMVIAMFSKALATSALAVVVAPELTKLALGLLAVIAVVVMVQLGFKSFKAGFMGAEIEATLGEAKEASQDAAQALQDLSASIGSEKAS